jgi:hypothetical protein
VDFSKYLKLPVINQIEIKQELGISRESKSKLKEIDNSELKPGDVVRGRMFTPEKPVTFNKLWTAEEQARLEELLKIYPDEPVASHRWTKIAEALGNRTPRQVASRTQKYFQKLAKQVKQSPKPVPSPESGVSNIKIKKKKRKVIPNGLHDDYYFPPPVSMPEDDHDQEEDSSSGHSFNESLSTINENGASPAQSSSTPNSQLEGQNEDYSFSDDDDMEFKMISSSLDPELKDTPEYKELLELMRLKHSVAHTKQKDTSHEGYKVHFLFHFLIIFLV